MSTPNLADQLRDVRISVRPELEISRHIFGGEAAYVVRDPVSFQSHRFSPEDYQIFTAISRNQKLGDVFQKVVEAEIVDEEREEDFYQFVISLTQRGLLNLPMANGNQLYKRYEEKKKSKRKNWLASVLFMRVPLVQPDRMLDQTMVFIRPLFTRWAFLIWSICLIAALTVVFSRWEEMTSPMASILAVGNIPVLWTLLVGLKIFHEFGHAYACKRFGGEVPEMGAYFIMMTPCAYVDASASWGFTSRWQRIMVALAGMYFEAIAAMFALVVWLLTPPGTLHDAAHYAMVLSTIVTIGFNANPLMRYDGYYVASDLSGIPNLRSQADSHFYGFLERVLFGVPKQETTTSLAQRTALTLFGFACVMYKVVLVFGISLVIAQKFPLIGFAVAAIYVSQSIKKSFSSFTQYLQSAPQLEGRRQRAIVVTGVCVLLAVTLVGAFPMPGGIETRAAVAPLKENAVRAQTPGFVRLVNVSSGEKVDSGIVICELENMDIETDERRLGLKVKAQQAVWKRAVFEDPQAVSGVESQLKELQQSFDSAKHRKKGLSVVTDKPGVVTKLEATREGMFLQKGDLIATVGSGPWTLRALLNTEQFVAAKIEPGDEVEFRLFSSTDKCVQGKVIQVIPQGQKKVERMELTQLAGGQIAVDPATSESVNPLFEVIILIPQGECVNLKTGSIAKVRFEGERVTLMRYMYRRGLQLFNDLRS